jgi:acetyl esterase/lipase
MDEHKGALTIWGAQIPYNTGESKLETMRLKRKPRFAPITLMRFAKVIGRDFIDDVDAVNAVTYAFEIKRDGAQETFDDTPYLTPFLVPDSDRAVIILPGGGYALKSSKSEGTDVARALNAAGISAFVLWYRVNPYRAPASFLDLQRAVRYLKHHAGDYGIDPGKVGVLGFSAGGHACATLVNQLRDAPVAAPGYTPDEVDDMDDRVALAGLIYPAIDLSYNPGILFALAEPGEVRDPATREALIARYSPARFAQTGDPPQFLCYGTQDALVDPQGLLAYHARLDALGVENRLLALKGAPHGFGACGGSLAARVAFGRFAHWMADFADWVHGVFDRIDQG